MTIMKMMGRVYTDEQFPRVVVELLGPMIHNILTVQEAGKDNKKFLTKKC